MVEIANQAEIIRSSIDSEKSTVSALLQLGLHAVKAADGYRSVRRAVTYEGGIVRISDDQYKVKDYERVYVVGFGKAAEPMAHAVHDILGGSICGGVILVPRGTRRHTYGGKIQVLEGGHPVPTYEGYENAKILTNVVRKVPKEKSLFLILLSGGGSSLYADFHPDLTFEEGVLLNKLLVNTSASIKEINAVRKHTAIGKGGAAGTAFVWSSSCIVSHL
jgi:glycerate 2-kinase